MRFLILLKVLRWLRETGKRLASPHVLVDSSFEKATETEQLQPPCTLIQYRAEIYD